MTQVRKNLVTNIISLGVNILVGILYTPFLVKTLGTEAYGIIPLALILNQYIVILTESLTSSITRFYSVEFFKKNYKGASEYFTTSVIFTIILMLLVVPLCLFPISHIDTLLHIPQKYLISAKFLFLLVIISLFIAVLSNCINITIFADNRVDLINYAKIIRHILKLGINIILFSLFSVDIVNVGIAYILCEIVVLLYSIWAYKATKNSEIHLSMRLFRFSIIKPVIDMITWVALICFAATFIYKIDALFVNNYFGLKYTGILSSISEFGSYCISITAVLGVLYKPLMLRLYSEEKYDELQNMTIRGSYVVGLASALLCAIIMGMSRPILNIWLTEEISAHYVWLVIKLGSIPLTTMGAFYATVNIYYNKVKKSALWSLAISLCYTVLCILFLEMGMSMESFLSVNFVVVVTQGFIMNVLIFNDMYSCSWKLIFCQCGKVLLFMAIIASCTYVLSMLFEINNLLNLLLSLSLIAFTGFIISLSFMSQADIDMLDVSLPVKKIIPKFINFSK